MGSGGVKGRAEGRQRDNDESGDGSTGEGRHRRVS
jgi:hypothetical protein